MEVRKTTGTKICKCGAPKDYRAFQCAKCAGVSYPVKGKHSFYDDTFLRDSIKNSLTIAEVSKKVSHNRKSISNYIKANKINIDHFKGTSNRNVPLQNVFTLSEVRKNTSIKRYALLYGILQNKCSICGSAPFWLEKPLNLELHHINGNPLDNTISNLQLLCPNCHSQTENNKGKNSKGTKKNKT